MKIKIFKIILAVIFSVVIYDSLAAEETYAAVTVPAAITQANVNPGITGGHHRRCRRRHIRRWHRRHWPF